VAAGLGLGALGGVAAGATVVMNAGASAPVAAVAPRPTLHVEADRAVIVTVTPAPATHRPAQHRVRASRGEHRRAIRSRAHRHPLRFGSHGSAVRWLQVRLGVRHTGRFATHTRAAVRRFQRRHHLHADGVVGRRTWTLLARTGPRHHHHRQIARHRPAPARHHATHRAAHLTVNRQVLRVLRVARAQRGKPYVWGAAGPRAFDCSGYVQWVFRHALGHRLPKYTDTQYRSLAHIRARKLRAGDLIFVREGRHESHVGIYAGRHRWWVAPHTGSHIKLQRVWGSHHVYARVIH
jgi:hypothetical protein